MTNKGMMIMTQSQFTRRFIQYMGIEAKMDPPWAYRMDTLVGLMVE